MGVAEESCLLLLTSPRGHSGSRVTPQGQQVASSQEGRDLSPGSGATPHRRREDGPPPASLRPCAPCALRASPAPLRPCAPSRESGFCPAAFAQSLPPTGRQELPVPGLCFSG